MTPDQEIAKLIKRHGSALAAATAVNGEIESRIFLMGGLLNRLSEERGDESRTSFFNFVQSEFRISPSKAASRMQIHAACSAAGITSGDVAGIGLTSLTKLAMLSHQELANNRDHWLGLARDLTSGQLDGKVREALAKAEPRKRTGRPAKSTNECGGIERGRHVTRSEHRQAVEKAVDLEAQLEAERFRADQAETRAEVAEAKDLLTGEAHVSKSFETSEHAVDVEAELRKQLDDAEARAEAAEEKIAGAWQVDPLDVPVIQQAVALAAKRYKLSPKDKTAALAQVCKDFVILAGPIRTMGQKRAALAAYAMQLDIGPVAMPQPESMPESDVVTQAVAHDVAKPVKKLRRCISRISKNCHGEFMSRGPHERFCPACRRLRKVEGPLIKEPEEDPDDLMRWHEVHVSKREASA